MIIRVKYKMKLGNKSLPASIIDSRTPLITQIQQLLHSNMFT